MLSKDEIIERVISLAKKKDIEISNILLYEAKLKYFKPFEIATARVVDEDALVLVVESHETDICGIGDGILPSGDQRHNVISQLLSVTKSIVGMKLSEAFKYIIANKETNTYMRIPMSIAILDAIAKVNKIRYGNLFGKINKEMVQTDITIGIEPLEETIEDAKKALNNGFRAIKLKVGKGGIKKDLERIQAVYNLIQDDASLRIDANQGWTLEEAKKIVKEIERQGVLIEILEQPLPRDKIEESAELKNYTEIPIVVDESVRTSADLEKLKNKVDGINLKVWKAGDPIEVFYMGRLAREMGMIVMIGCSGETNIGITVDTYLASTIPVDFADLDSDLLKEDVVSQKITRLKNGYRILPKHTGLGIETSNLIVSKLKQLFP